MGPEGGQQRGDDGDDDFADAAKQLLSTVFHGLSLEFRVASKETIEYRFRR